MKKALLFPALALALATASCTSTTEETTTTDMTVDTMTAPMETTPTTDVNGMTPPDNTEGGISTGPSDASMDATGIGTGVGAGASARGASGSRSATTVNTSGRGGTVDRATNTDKNANTTTPESTYPEARPGQPLDGRMPAGTSK